MKDLEIKCEELNCLIEELKEPKPDLKIIISNLESVSSDFYYIFENSKDFENENKRLSEIISILLKEKPLTLEDEIYLRCKYGFSFEEKEIL